MKEYIPKQFENRDQVLIEIDSLNRIIHSKLLTIGNDYSNKITGKITNDRYYQIRDSITLRIESIVFHYNLLNSIHSPSKKIITNEIFPLGTDIIPLRQKFLFDSIIFNLISVFDYLSCLINFIIEKNKDKWKKPWNKLEHWSRCNDKFKGTKLGLKIIEINKDWVSNLNDYRNELIHYQTENLGSNESYDLMNAELDILVIAPNQLKRFFKQLTDMADKNEYNINSVTLWLIKTSIENVIEALDDIKEYIEDHRVIPVDKAVYTYVKQ